MDTSQFFCPNEECPDYGVRGKGNIVRNGRYGKQRTQLKCKTCGEPFSENPNIPFFGLCTPKEEVVHALQELAERATQVQVEGGVDDQGRAGAHRFLGGDLSGASSVLCGRRSL